MKDIKQVREEFEQLGKIYPQKASVKVEQDSVNGVKTYWFTAEDAMHMHF